MGSLYIKDGEPITFHKPEKGRVYKDCQMVRVDARVCVLKTDDGKFYVAGDFLTPHGKWAVTHYGSVNFSTEILNGLAQLGATDQEAIDAHIKFVAEEKVKFDQLIAGNHVLRYLDSIGIDPTPEQREKINKAKGRM